MIRPSGSTTPGSTISVSVEVELDEVGELMGLPFLVGGAAIRARRWL
jgi:hypothetical protein